MYTSPIQLQFILVPSVLALVSHSACKRSQRTQSSISTNDQVLDLTTDVDHDDVLFLDDDADNFPSSEESRSLKKRKSVPFFIVYKDVSRPQLQMTTATTPTTKPTTKPSLQLPPSLPINATAEKLKKDHEEAEEEARKKREHQRVLLEQEVKEYRLQQQQRRSNGAVIPVSSRVTTIEQDIARIRAEKKRAWQAQRFSTSTLLYYAGVSYVSRPETLPYVVL